MARFDRKQNHLSHLASIFSLVAFLFLWSCGHNPMTVPESTDSEHLQADDVVFVPQLLKSNPVKPVKKSKNASKSNGTSKSKKIKAKKGGKVKHNGHEIKVPKGAISDDAVFSITILSTQFMDLEFKPDGTFLAPVEITISYDDADLTGISEDDLTIAWYDPDSGIYYDVGATIDKKKKCLKVKVMHFTQYSLSVR